MPIGKVWVEVVGGALKVHGDESCFGRWYVVVESDFLEVVSSRHHMFCKREMVILISVRTQEWGGLYTDPGLESQPCKHSLSTTICVRDEVEMDSERLMSGGTTKRGDGHFVETKWPRFYG